MSGWEKWFNPDHCDLIDWLIQRQTLNFVVNFTAWWLQYTHTHRRETATSVAMNQVQRLSLASTVMIYRFQFVQHTKITRQTRLRPNERHLCCNMQIYINVHNNCAVYGRTRVRLLAPSIIIEIFKRNLNWCSTVFRATIIQHSYSMLLFCCVVLFSSIHTKWIVRKNGKRTHKN